MSRGQNVRGALDFAGMATRMIEDPDLTGDALLLGLGAAERLNFPERYKGRARSEASWSGIARRVFGEDDRWKGHANRLLRSVIRDDIPRYSWFTHGEVLCGAPMIRREGKCGQRVSLTWGDRDPETGVGKLVGLCTRHRRAPIGREIEQLRRDRLLAWRANGEPEPPANTGGVLARYFDTDWQTMYEWADAHRAAKASPEGKPATPPRPALTLIRGDDET